MTCTRPQAKSQKNPLTRGRRPHMTPSRPKPGGQDDRNFAAQQVPPSRSLKVAPIIAPVHSDGEIETAIIALGREPRGGLVVMPDA